MRVLVVGATGAIGARLVPRLIEQGHEVLGTSRSARSAGRLRTLGAEPVVLDLLDPGAVTDVVGAVRPDAIIHQATALAGLSDFKHFDRTFALTNRLRTEGTDSLLALDRGSPASVWGSSSGRGGLTQRPCTSGLWGRAVGITAAQIP